MRRTIGLFLLLGACVLVGVVAHDAAAAVIRVPGDFFNLQDAIDAAVPGDRIIVDFSGNDYSPIVINKDNLWIIGDGRAFIDGCCDCDTTAVLITGKNNRFQGFDVDGGGNGVVIEGEKNVVVANIIHHHCDNGVLIRAGAKNNQVIANVAFQNDQNGFNVGEDAGKGNQLIQNVAFDNRNGIVIRIDTTANGNITTGNSDGFVVLGPGTKLKAQGNVMLVNGEEFWDHDVEIDPDAKVNLPKLEDQNVFRSLASNVFE